MRVCKTTPPCAQAASLEPLFLQRHYTGFDTSDVTLESAIWANTKTLPRLMRVNPMFERVTRGPNIRLYAGD